MRRLAKRRLERVAPGTVLRWQFQNQVAHEVELQFLDLIVDPRREAVDAGANLGIVTALLARNCVHVHAFESDEWLARRLRTAGLPNV